MNKGNLEAFLSYLQEQVDNHSVYVWGAQGQHSPTITENWIRQREQNTGGTKINGTYKTYADIAVDFWRKQCEEGYKDKLRAYDCSGLVCFYLLGGTGDEALIYTDRTANGLRALCEEVTEPRKGYWLFRVNEAGRATHIGVMISDTEYIHAKGRAYGVCKEKLSEHKNYWHKYGKPNCFEFEQSKLTKYVHPKGSVRVREGNGKKYKVISPTATKDDYLPYLGQATEEPYWYLVEWQEQEGYISSNKKYTEVVQQ